MANINLPVWTFWDTLWYILSPSFLLLIILIHTCFLIKYICCLEAGFKKHYSLKIIFDKIRVKSMTFFSNWNCILHFVKAIEKLSKTCLDIVSSCFQSVLLSDYRFQHIIFMWGIYKLFTLPRNELLCQHFGGLRFGTHGGCFGATS